MDSGSMSMSNMDMSTTMSITMSTTGSPTSTMSGMSMASSTGSSMPMSSSSMMGMDSMAMVFFTSSSTPLYSWAWTPDTTGQYAGTCIFLIAFAAIFRALLAVRVRFYDFLALAKHRQYGGVSSQPLTDAKPISRPWRANEAVMIAMVDVILAGLSYLL